MKKLITHVFLYYYMSTKLYVMIGKPGHGKSFISEYISDRTNGIRLSTDRIRKERIVEDGNPNYTTEESRKTYNKLFEIAKKKFDKGRTVVLDGTFNIKKGRDQAKQIGGKQTEFVLIDCSEDVAKNRIKNRDSDESDADLSVYNKVDIQPIENYDYTVIDNSGNMEQTKRQVENKLF